jgi:negative regulator of sigma E activity
VTGSAGSAGAAPRSCRLTALLIGIGILLTAAPVAAAPRGADRAAHGEQAALRLLEQAAKASRDLSYSGTKYVAAWRTTGSTTTLVEVLHEPGRGLRLSTSPTAGAVGDDGLLLAATSLDQALLRVLAETYDLRVAGSGRCTGRDATVVEARRADGAAVAGRFWLDRETGLLLRREVYDGEGRRVRSSAFVDLELSSPSVSAVSAGNRPVTRDRGRAVRPAELRQLREQGWPVPDELPGGYALFESRSRSHAADGGGGQVLHLAYSDGLSTTSLFAQAGDLGAEPPAGFVRRQVGGHPVWVHDGAPERMVWAGGGRVWTLVSDAPEAAVTAAVEVLPHDDLPASGLQARLGRGLSRLGSWLNPFD